LKSSGLKLIGSGKGIFIYTTCFAARAEVIPLRRLTFVFRMLAKG
jgi:hypothetical protein